jgi:hypothetical protein
MAMTRKQFIGGLAGGTVLLVFTGCGGGGGGYTSGGGMSGSGCTTTIAANHDHVLVVPLSDLSSTVDKSYDIRGTADHTHTVTLTAAQLAQLKAGQSVNVNSTTTASMVYGTHFHAVSVSCVM